MSTASTALPYIVLHGPAMSGVAPAGDDALSLWTLRAGAPAFGLENVRPSHTGVQEDRTYPVRTLLVDSDSVTRNHRDWRNPRLASIHLIAGHLEGHYGDPDYNAGHNEPPRIWLNVGNTTESLGSFIYTVRGRELRFRTVDASIGDGNDGDATAAAWQHVIAAPLLGKNDAWPEGAKDAIDVPSFRLVAGDVDLIVMEGELPWLDALRPIADITVGRLNYFRLRLTPDGIEFVAHAPFPRIDGVRPIRGRFLLTHDGTGFLLRLLTDRPETDMDAWVSAWDSVTPADDVAEESIVGFKVEGRRGAPPPSFVWRVPSNQWKLGRLNPIVELDPAEVSVRLLSPRGPTGVDGIVDLKPRSYTLAAFTPQQIGALIPTPLQALVTQQWVEHDAPKVVLTAQLDAAGTTETPQPEFTTAFLIDGAPARADCSLVPAGKAKRVAHACAHDEPALAAALRRVYGARELSPDRYDAERPLLAAFVPLDDGWLQIPVPNLPPPDLSKDSSVLRAPLPAPSNVISGYLRFAQHGDLSGVLSAFPGPGALNAPHVEEAPWILTIEGAQSASVAIGLGQRDGQTGPLRAAAALQNPQLSMRGFVWISSDAPDELEALPRLGAGAGAYLDIPLETYDIEQESLVQYTLTDLALSVTTQERTEALRIVRTRLAMAAGLNLESSHWKKLETVGEAVLTNTHDLLVGSPGTEPVAVVWQRHPQMPLASTLPMTRAASSAVRPLESRDLVPFAIESEQRPSGRRGVVRMTWHPVQGATPAFPQLFQALDSSDERPLKLRTVAAWPWRPEGDIAKPRGIAMAAFGVPGTEFAFPSNMNATETPWSLLLFAHRHDMPAGDEAFAMAALPRTKDEPPVAGAATAESDQDEATKEMAATATALDWKAMASFWTEQERRHQNARVMHSYLCEYRPPRVAKGKAKDLIGGATWETDLGFRNPDDSTQMPYGAVVIGVEMTGNRALLGVTGRFSVTGEKLTQAGDQINIIGHSPSTFEERGFLMDSRRSGTRPLQFVAGDAMLWRPISVPDSDVPGTVSLCKPIAIVDRDGGSDLFEFWVKDLPLGADGKAVIPPAGVDPTAWQDGRLPLSGIEWRLATRRGDESGVFAVGRDRIPFFGFALEPLRLEACEFHFKDGVPTGGVKTASVLARLYLGPRTEGPEHGGNLIMLELNESGNSALVVSALKPRSPLSFAMPARNAGEQARRIAVDPVIDIAGNGWRNGRPAFSGSKLTITMFGLDVLLSDAVITPASNAVGNVSVVWHGNIPDDWQLHPGQGMLAVDMATINTGTDADGEPDDTVAHIEFTRRIAIAPYGGGPKGQPITAPMQFKLRGNGITHYSLLKIEQPPDSGQETPLDGTTFIEHESAFALTIKGSSLRAADLLPALGGAGALSLGLVGRVEPVGQSSDGQFSLQVGYFDAEIVYAVASMPAALKRATIHAEASTRLPPPDKPVAEWVGHIAFYGRLSLVNAIAWPVVSGDSVVPWPKRQPNGRTPIAVDPTLTRRHSVTYTLDGHTMSLDLAARILAGEDGATWEAVLAGTHVVTKPSSADAELSFTAIETIILGRAAAIVSPADGYEQHDPVTFAARYADLVVDGEDSGDRETGMLAAGVGRIGTVLRGALGAAFRRAFWDSGAVRADILLVAGGFVGLLGDVDGRDAPLLRLPVLAALDPLGGLEPGCIEQNGLSSISIAWPDGRAARHVITTLRGAVAPASRSQRALHTALSAGAISRPEKLGADNVAFAVLVEQSFAAGIDRAPSLHSTPFFIAAAISLANALEHFQSQSPLATNPSTAPSVSFVAARIGRDGTDMRNVVAAIVARRLPPEGLIGASRDDHPQVVFVGDDVVVRTWTGPAVFDLGLVPTALVAGPAFIAHVHPRVALLRTRAKGVELWSYDEQGLPRKARPARAVPPRALRQYADGGRGYAIGFAGDAVRWLAAPEEGPTQPFRDADPNAQEPIAATGLAGLSREVAFPAHAAAVLPQDPTNAPVVRAIVWCAQTRVPIYLPLPLAGLEGPQLPWLTPAAPRPRLPADTAVVDALSEAVNATRSASEVGTGVALGIQPILPERATLASVGDRAGISLAHMIRLETALGEFSTFDQTHSRFGRPGQGGCWSVRTERTPRPGPLPENVGDPVRDRRPCASPLLPKTPLFALTGPADTIRGERSETVGAWTVTFIAASEWDGIVTEMWDGTIPFVAQLYVETLPGQARPQADADLSLFQLLFPPDPTTTEFTSRASLVIGDAVIPFRRLHALGPGIFEEISSASRPLWRGEVRLVLDARTTDTSSVRGAAMQLIAAAFSRSQTLPKVEIRWVVEPSSTRQAPTVASRQSYYNLGLEDPTAPSIPTGPDRPPVTLRFPLFPVIKAYGALPIVPTSLIFVDPAYDAGLASAPVEARGRIAAPNVQLEPMGRGELACVLYADRARVNRSASITFMIDIAFEKKVDGLARATFSADGDIASYTGAFGLKIAVQHKTGERRTLYVGRPAAEPVAGFKPPQPPPIGLGTVYELALSALIKEDGTAAGLVAGDMLELEVSEAQSGAVQVTLLDATTASDGLHLNTLHVSEVVRTLRILLTDEPVVEPPPALYAALVRRETGRFNPQVRMSLPLYAQSPLPWRVDLRDAKADFRAGLMRRSATFIWSLARPRNEQAHTGMHIVKLDRNGQTYLPTAAGEDYFVKAKRFMPCLD